MARRYVTKDGKEWVNMVVTVEKLLDVLEGKAEAAGINQLENEADVAVAPVGKHAAEV